MFVGLLVVVPLTGCSTKKDVRLLQEEIASLAERQEAAIQSLEALTAATQDTIRGQSESLFSLRGETLRALNQIRDDLTILQELTGQNQRDLAAIRDQPDRLSAEGAIDVRTSIHGVELVWDCPDSAGDRTATVLESAEDCDGVLATADRDRPVD